MMISKERSEELRQKPTLMAWLQSLTVDERDNLIFWYSLLVAAWEKARHKQFIEERAAAE